MKKYNLLSTLLLCCLGVPALCLPVLANSSWHWLSETRPYDVLPVVILLTLAIEIGGICLINRSNEVAKCGFYVLLGNLLSFAAPYLFLRLFPAAPYEFWQTLEQTPFYTVGVVYLILTVVIEVPVVYLALQKTLPDKKRLLLTLIGTNVVTTVLTAAAERLFCQGSW